MKKLVALASMAVLLCASASFAKKAMDEEEMDLVTAAGQPSVIDVDVTTSGNGVASATTTSDSTVNSTIDNTLALSDSTASATTDPTAIAANFGIGANVTIPALGGLTIAGNAALNIAVADADIETFDLAVASGGIGTLSATASAAASSTVNGATASVTAMNQDSSTTTLLVASGSQSQLRAMVLNNVVGENQIANGINIQSGFNSASGSHSNDITQSWGSTYDWTFAAGGVDTVTATASAAAGNGGNDNTFSKVNCVLSAVACGNSDNSGGDASTSAAAAAASFDNIPLTIAADKISRVRVNSVGDATVNVSEMDSSVVTSVIDSDSQTNLAALAVNNIAGKNQIANAFNIAAAGGISIGDQGAALPRISFGSATVGGTSPNSSAMSNTINQYRGTPNTQ